MIADGVSMSIPMPGHAIPTGADDHVRADVAKLHELVRQHDVIYLLTGAIDFNSCFCDFNSTFFVFV